MEGGTVFRFVSGSPTDVLAMARDAAGEKDIQVSGGVGTLRAFLKEGLVDEAHIAVIPIVLARGERLWDGLEDLTDHYDVSEAVGIGNITHLRLVKRTV
jgi:dihydrofolate reductase